MGRTVTRIEFADGREFTAFVGNCRAGIGPTRRRGHILDVYIEARNDRTWTAYAADGYKLVRQTGRTKGSRRQVRARVDVAGLETAARQVRKAAAPVVLAIGETDGGARVVCDDPAVDVEIPEVAREHYGTYDRFALTYDAFRTGDDQTLDPAQHDGESDTAYRKRLRAYRADVAEYAARPWPGIGRYSADLLADVTKLRALGGERDGSESEWSWLDLGIRAAPRGSARGSVLRVRVGTRVEAVILPVVVRVTDATTGARTRTGS